MSHLLIRPVICLLCCSFLSQHAIAQALVRVEQGDAGMVVSDSAHASRAGSDCLQQGGNAVDAAVATALALAVTWPEAGNIGGGGFMLIRPADGKSPVCVDYRETAPLSMHRTSFQRDDHTHSEKAVGVPGTIAGLALAHQRFGKLPWRDLVLPAIRLAREGFAVDPFLADSLNAVLAKPGRQNEQAFAELRRVYGKPDRTHWQAGDRIVLPELAQTLALIAEDPSVFYRGALADLLIAQMQRGNGQITREDLRQYKAKLRPALIGSFRDYTIIGAPPPSSGGTCLIEALNILENFELSDRDRFDSRNVHLIAEAMRRVFADRARFLGDPDFTEIPTHLISKAHAQTLAASIDLRRATDSALLTPELALQPESPDTTHFSIVDAAGMAVSNTYTLEASWGSRIIVQGAGFVLNNEMGDFNWFPGETNQQGRIGTEPNTVAGGKRMLSSQCPAMVQRDDKLVFVTGSPGGRTIINTVICNILNLIEFKMSPAAAIAAARQHHQWFPDRLYLEDLDRPHHARIAQSLRDTGHTIVGRSSQGSAHSIAIDPATQAAIGIADYRRGGRPAAVSSDTLAVWEFSDPAGTSLAKSAKEIYDGSVGVPKLAFNWNRDTDGAVVNGRDQLKIHRDPSSKPLDALLPLPSRELADGPVTLTVMIDSATFSGELADEQLCIGFTRDGNETDAVARLILGRDGDGNISIRGEAPADGESIPAAVLARGNSLDQPIILRLTVDIRNDSYRIEIRSPDQSVFRTLGRAKLAPNRETRFLRISVLGDFCSPDDTIAIDRLELSH